MFYMCVSSESVLCFGVHGSYECGCVCVLYACSVSLCVCVWWGAVRGFGTQQKVFRDQKKGGFGLIFLAVHWFYDLYKPCILAGFSWSALLNEESETAQSGHQG